MAERIVGSSFFGKLLEICIPLLTWIIITLPIWLSPFHPAVVAYFIICFDLYFLYKAATFTYLATISYRKVALVKKNSYDKKLLGMRSADELRHFIIIPNYSEPLHKLDATLSAIVKTDYPFKNIYLVLAFEERETDAQKKAQALEKKYRPFFQDIVVTYHPLLSHEAQGKASNQTYSAKIVDEYVIRNNLKRENVIITICDADSQLPKNYFSYLSYTYLKDSDRLYHFYWAPVLLYNNFWKLPFFVRMQATLSSIIRLAFASLKEDLIQISTYSVSLSLLKKINFWDVDVIPEDWHVFYQAFFTFGERIKTIPLFTIVNSDAVYSGGLIKTSTNRYDQERRWAWGVSDIGYTLKRFFRTPHIRVIPKLKRILFLIEAHLFWPTSFFILTISASIPPLVNPVFKRTVLGFLLPQLSGLILTTASVLLILYVYLDFKLRQNVNVKTKPLAVPFLFIQWYFLPWVSFLFSSLPALEAHTRILLGKKIRYKVTEKV
ncbi:glycosyltransferase family 2 protein [Candidatus Roizmanbacteria bacterium]|nr:glycosyltransferase family 2 protein [Candidatus Roizmanbacteria bacterium]